jgi:hypothetical protein
MTSAAKPHPKPKPAKRSTIIDAMSGIFEPWFRGSSWDGWKAVLKAADCLPMTAAEIEFFKTISGGREPPTKRVSELVAAAARRVGKDSIASGVATHSAALFDQQDRLRPGDEPRFCVSRLRS